MKRYGRASMDALVPIIYGNQEISSSSKYEIITKYIG